MSWRISIAGSTLFVALTACEPIGQVGGTVGKAPAVSLVSGSTRGGSYSAKPYVTSGAIDTGHPSVGLLTGGSASCTATLIGKRTVLTAAHCLDRASATFKVAGKSYNASRLIRHPGYSPGSNDIGVVILANEVAGVKPSPIAASAPAKGQAIVLVGFGKGGAPSSSSSAKRMGSNSIAALGATTFSFNAGNDACGGDSGGPTFVFGAGEEIVVGVHSTESAFCGHAGTDTRVDLHREWIASSAAGDAVTPGAATPPSFPPPGASEALEGQSCATVPCRPGLACTEIYRAGYPQLVGKSCLERCARLGGDSNCEGQESCTESRNVGLVCFDSENSRSGFCSGAVACDGPTAPQPAPAPDPQPAPAPDPQPTTPAPPPASPPSGSCGGAEESQVFELLNKERAAYGLGALQCDPVGLKAARAHSQDMCDRGYFDHYTPEGLGPWDRLAAAGAQFGASGENIAMGYSTPQEVHTGWMNSSGHRDNILTPSWQRAAVGLASCGGTPYWTQVFMD